MRYHYFLGIDVSKSSLDLTLLKEETFILHQKVANTLSGIRSCLQQLKAKHRAGGKSTLVCLEITGPYQAHLMQAFKGTTASLWLESPLTIKRSLGLQRGKSDRLDSLRIARFAYLNRAHARLYEPPRPVIQELKTLNGLRARLQTALFSLQTPLAEREGFIKKGADQRVRRCCAHSQKVLAEDLQRTEEEMSELIESDDRLNHLYNLITSVKFVGKRLAIELLITTNEFKKFPSAKALACYCGIAPFEHTSGTSLRGKTKVSPLANRRFKMMLHMPSLSALHAKGELRDYYLRKVSEGKPKMSVVNAIKNKLLHRVFACVRDDRPFVDQYTKFDRQPV